MSIERELLKKVISGDNKGDFFISYDLYKEIYEFLVHPEHTEQEPVTDKPTETAMAVMPNGVCVSNVYDAYEEGRKSLMSEQEPEAWILEDKKTGYRRQSAYKPTVLLKEAYKVIPLYTAPPKLECINHDDILDRSIDGSFEYRDGFMDGVLYAENHHGITGDGE
jgi:hypothetical protein